MIQNTLRVGDKQGGLVESRSGLILRTYWEQLRGNRPFPEEREINPEEIAEIWPSCFLISIDDVTRRMGYRYSYMGEKLVEAYGDDLRNPEIIMELISIANSNLTRNFDEVVRTKSPVIDESEFVNLQKSNIKYRVSMFPLGFKDGQVSHILGCMRWRMY